MTDFTVQSLEIENFKGIRSLHLDFSDTVTHIYGDNATGKTTIYDALTWLLFGKDSSGSAKFTVKPTGRKGVTPTVTAICKVNGQVHKLRKVLRERWSKPRGFEEAQYEGDTVDYTVDDVPKKEAAYKRVIAGFVNEEVFRLLTGVHQFARDLPWKERRRILAEVCGLPDDAAILAGAPQFARLSEVLGTRTTEEYKAALLMARKDANQTLDSLPIRMDECERRVAALSGMDFEAAQAEQQACTERANAVRAALAKLEGDALVTEAQAEYKALVAEQKALEAENIAYRESQRGRDERPALRAQLLQLETELDNIRAQMSRAQTAMVQGQLQLDRLAERETIPLVDTCPTCGQPLPPAHLARVREQAENARQAREKDRLFVQQSVQQAEQTVSEQTEALRQKTAARDACAARLAACPPPALPSDLPDYHTRKCALDLQLAGVTDHLAALQGGQEHERKRLMESLAELETARAKAERVLAARAHLEETRARLSELASEQQTCDAKLRALDQDLALCEEFTRYKVRFLTHAVNCRFELARFCLFHEQVNGGLADCCEVMVDGVPYADLNHAMQVNVGVDIIRTLSAHYGLRVPLVVDNAESVTQLQSIPTQVIRLVVSAPDHTLRVETC